MNESRPTVVLPEDFRAALKQCGLLGFFLRCAYVHRAGYLGWITSPVRRETRARRIQQAVMRLAAQRAEEALVARHGAEPGEHCESPAEFFPKARRIA